MLLASDCSDLYQVGVVTLGGDGLSILPFVREGLRVVALLLDRLPLLAQRLFFFLPALLLLINRVYESPIGLPLLIVEVQKEVDRVQMLLVLRRSHLVCGQLYARLAWDVVGLEVPLVFPFVLFGVDLSRPALFTQFLDEACELFASTKLVAEPLHISEPLVDHV